MQCEEDGVLQSCQGDGYAVSQFDGAVKGNPMGTDNQTDGAKGGEGFRGQRFELFPNAGNEQVYGCRDRHTMPNERQ